jgi:hypothetical protein
MRIFRPKLPKIKYGPINRKKLIRQLNATGYTRELLSKKTNRELIYMVRRFGPVQMQPMGKLSMSRGFIKRYN